ncbi:hypothetical protein MettiDRAFT_2371 [Methanolobus tindarius DSM 2278]|uniref:Uncharacterized protein n=1 Tax=Methanolobus tindarius DSM 2278 TaxID=1090322 RepID=W9DSV4_METTI|nr:hypothetical protein [Methanolobus tindarius]ETA68883.1 hypothetical protein MettiDRAFT_2371 [Methanolobus tindarius DSM 2278]
MNDTTIQSENELYDRINEYRKNKRTGALTSLDVQSFIETQSTDLLPDIVLKNIILGNACGWGTYDIACEHFENHMQAFRHFQVFNV